jgi:hypothetical protein
VAGLVDVVVARTLALAALLVLAGCGAARALPHGHGWPSDAELAWQKRLGSHPCDVPSPPTQRLVAAYRLVHSDCTDTRIEFARRRALLGYQQTLAPGRLVFNKNGGSYTNTDYSRVASHIAHKHVDAHCWSFDDWSSLDDEVAALYHHGAEFRASGFANIGADSIELDPYTCTTLAILQVRALDNDYRRYALGFAEAVDTLAHEATHARGIDNEARTECYAIQLVPETARMLGLPARIGRLFANAMWRNYRNEPKGYATKRCHDGGPLDLHPASAIWP